MVKKIIYIDRDNYDRLVNGETITINGVEYTYDYDAIYYCPKSNNIESIIDISAGLTEENLHKVQQNPGALLKGISSAMVVHGETPIGDDNYIFTPTYIGDDNQIPSFYSSIAADEPMAYWIEISWNSMSIIGGTLDFNNFVDLTSNQTINGQKTFTDDVIIGPAIVSNGAIQTASAFTSKNRANYVAGLNITSGAIDVFYCANQRSDFFKHSMTCGDHSFTDWESGTLYDGQGSTGPYFNLSTYPISASSPVVIQICSGNDEIGYKTIEHTDVLECMLHTHTFDRNRHFLTDYKIEILCKPGYDTTDPLPASEVSWYTIIERHNVHDDVEGLTFRPDNQNVTGTNYASFRGLRITINGYESIDNYFYLSEIQLLNHRGSGVPAASVGALPLSGGTVYGNIYTTNIYPRNNSCGLGANSYWWSHAYINNVYATYISENGIALSNKYAAKSHTHKFNDNNPNYTLVNKDTRNANSTPEAYYSSDDTKRSLVSEFKLLNAIDSPFSIGSYCNLFTVNQWTDSTGEYANQIVVASAGVAFRNAQNGTTWNSWKQFIMSDNACTINDITNIFGATRS